MIIYVNYAMLLFNYFDLSLMQTQEEIICLNIDEQSKKADFIAIFNKTISEILKI